MTEILPETELSPLDQIRMVEAELTRKIIAAREVSGGRLADARAQATRIKKKARESGTYEGRILYKEIVAKARDEAHAIAAQAQNQTAELRQKGSSRMQLAVEYATSIVLGLEKEGRDDES